MIETIKGVKCSTCCTKIQEGVKYHKDRTRCVLCQCLGRTSTLVPTVLRVHAGVEKLGDGGYVQDMKEI